MVFYRCGICRRRVPSNKIKNKAGAPLRWPAIQKYQEKYGLIVGKTDPVCGKCDSLFSFPLGACAKIPSYIPRIDDENQRGRPSKPTIEIQIPTEGDFGTGDEQIENSSPSSIFNTESGTNQLPENPSSPTGSISHNSQDSSQNSSSSSFDSQDSSGSQVESLPGISDAETLFSQESFDDYMKNTQAEITGSGPDDLNAANSMPVVCQGQRSLVLLDVSAECYPCNNPTSSRAIHTCNLTEPQMIEIPDYIMTSVDPEDSVSHQTTSSQEEDEHENDFCSGFSDTTTIYSSCDLNFNSQSQDGSNSQELPNDELDLEPSQPSQQSSEASQSNSSNCSSQLSDLQSDSQVTSQSSIFSESVSVTSSLMKPPGLYLPFKSFKPTDRKCFICDSTGKGSRCRVSKVCAVDLGMRTNILVGSTVRACAHHTKNGLFTPEAIEMIKVSVEDPKKSTKDVYFSNEEVGDLVKDMFQFMRSLKSDLDFGLSSKFSDEDFQVLLGMKKENFENLFSIVGPKLNNSCHRSPRNALALFLMKIRLSLSQQVLGILFGGIPQSSVSETIDRVSLILDKHFASLHLDYSEERREKIQEEHQSQYASKVCGAGGENLVTVWDGTYIYVGKPSGHSAQRDIYSSQKKRSLVKEMMVVTPTGYIVNCDGAYRAADNDAKIMNTMLMDRSGNGVWSLLEEGDFLILDRGFKESEKLLEKFKLKHIMPKFMNKKQSQFTTQEANDSRIVTLLRWVVEVVNGRVKNIFRFFDGAIPASYIPKIHRFFRIACAIINAYHPPIFQDREIHEDLAIRIFERVNRTNDLMTRIEEEGLDRKRKIWTLGTSESIPDFPVLSIDDLRRLTLGVYQVNMAELYCREHLKNSDYVIYFNTNDSKNKKSQSKNKPNDKEKNKNNNNNKSKSAQSSSLAERACSESEQQTESRNVNQNEEPTTNRKLIMAKLHSRYSNSKIHKTFLEYDPEKQGEDCILGWYCSCQCGARTLGCCSHIAAVMWFLGYSRHLEPQLPKRRSLCDSIINATERFRQQEEIQSGGVRRGTETREVPEEMVEGSTDDTDSSCSDDGCLDPSDQEEVLQGSGSKKINRKRGRATPIALSTSSDDENIEPVSIQKKTHKRPKRIQKSRIVDSSEVDESSDSKQNSKRPCKKKPVKKAGGGQNVTQEQRKKAKGEKK